MSFSDLVNQMDDDDIHSQKLTVEVIRGDC